jgi:hypothetical protein
LAGGAILRGRAWGRWFGISAASLNAIGQTDYFVRKRLVLENTRCPVLGRGGEMG